VAKLDQEARLAMTRYLVAAHGHEVEVFETLAQASAFAEWLVATEGAPLAVTVEGVTDDDD
jgi:hypothetical protein